jgi:hypothetical protein
MQYGRRERDHAEQVTPLHCASVTPEPPSPRWQAALAYALLGPPVRDLAETGAPRVADLVADLADRSGGVEALRREVSKARARAWARGTWPYAVPGALREGLGAAQFAAALTALLAELPPDGGANAARSVVRDRALTADERRLLADRPPHHGG